MPFWLQFASLVRLSQEDVLAQMRVVVNGWPPEGVRVRHVPVYLGGENGGDAAAEARLIPCARVPFPNFAYRRIAVSVAHARHRDALLGDITGIGADEKVKKLALGISHDREIAVAAREVVIGRIAAKRVRSRLENESEVIPICTIVAGAYGADFRGS